MDASEATAVRPAPAREATDAPTTLWADESAIGLLGIILIVIILLILFGVIGFSFRAG